MKRRHLMMTDEDWEEFKKHMADNTQEALANSAYPFAQSAELPDTSDPLSCPTYCPECRGANYKVDSNGEVFPCPNYQARVDRKNRTVSEPESPPEMPLEGTGNDFPAQT